MKTKNSGAGFCVPRVKPNSRTTGDREITVNPMTLLDRFREAVLRLIMISAVSKSTSSRHRNKQSPATERCQKYYNYSTDTYHSEDVADCIEFIRTKKAIHDLESPNGKSLASTGSPLVRASTASLAITGLSVGQYEKEERVSLELTEEIIQSMEPGAVFRDYNCRVSSIDFHKTSTYMVTASDDDSIRLYDVATASCLKTINSKKYGVDLVCFTSHPTTVIYSSRNGWDDSLRLLSLHDNKYLRYFKGHHDRVVSLSLCSAGECFISGSLDRTVLLWDQRVEKCQGLLRAQGRPAAAYDDQGLVFAIAFGGYIRMFDARMYEKGPFENFSVGGDLSEANVVKFSNDGRLMLLTTMDGHIHVLDSFRGTLLSTYSVKPVAEQSTLDATFSPEGMFVVSGSGDGSTHAWGVRSGKQVHSWMGHGSEPPVIKWAPGSPMFVTGSSELAFVIPDLSKLPAYAIRK